MFCPTLSLFSSHIIFFLDPQRLRQHILHRYIRVGKHSDTTHPPLLTKPSLMTGSCSSQTSRSAPRSPILGTCKEHGKECGRAVQCFPISRLTLGLGFLSSEQIPGCTVRADHPGYTLRIFYYTYRGRCIPTYLLEHGVQSAIGSVMCLKKRASSRRG